MEQDPSLAARLAEHATDRIEAPRWPADERVPRRHVEAHQLARTNSRAILGCIGASGVEPIGRSDEFLGLILQHIVAPTEIDHVLVSEEARALKVLEFIEGNQRFGDLGVAGIVTGRSLVS
jgi:hypothetical protein